MEQEKQWPVARAKPGEYDPRLLQLARLYALELVRGDVAWMNRVIAQRNRHLCVVYPLAGALIRYVWSWGKASWRDLLRVAALCGLIPTTVYCLFTCALYAHRRWCASRGTLGCDMRMQWMFSVRPLPDPQQQCASLFDSVVAATVSEPPSLPHQLAMYRELAVMARRTWHWVQTWTSVGYNLHELHCDQRPDHLHYHVNIVFEKVNLLRLLYARCQRLLAIVNK